MKFFKNKKVLEILKRYESIASLKSLEALAGWDLNTYMPHKAAADRGFILGKVNILIKKMLLDKDLGKLIDQAEKAKNLNDYEKGVLRVLKKEIDILKKLPDKFIEDFNKITNEAQIAWKKAKIENNFKLFQGYLEKIINLIKKETEFLGYKEHPYDALVDLYEEGWTTKDFYDFFEQIKTKLKNLFDEIRKTKFYCQKHPLENEKYDNEKMKRLNLEILKILNFDPERSRIDIAPHPFEESISLNDVRITTWYHSKDFRRSLSATIHEFGHSLYELNIRKEFQFTPLQRGISYGFHESQSRFWENIIGRNQEFLKRIFPIAKNYLTFLKKYSFEDFYVYFNLIRPSLIRVEADEITYHFHIILRFEIEKDLLEEKIKIRDLPEIWQAKMKEYLTISPKNYTEGVLQDIHWSMGAFGYFPTYSLGTFLSAFWLYFIERDIGKLEKLLKEKNGLEKIQDWLKRKIHNFGKTYLSKELIKKATGRSFSPDQFFQYLENKYL